VTGIDPAELAAHRFATGLSASQLELLAARASAVYLPAGQRIFEEGGPATKLWLISTGRVALDLRVPGRGRLIVETLGAGDELGLSWLSPMAQWQFGAAAQLSVSAFELASAAIIELCENDHDLGYQLTRRLLGTAIARLQAARIRILDVYAAPGSAVGKAGSSVGKPPSAVGKLR
jgi:CRP/FNR family transcriptional regulator, cyclic AMP receptor protein